MTVGRSKGRGGGRDREGGEGEVERECVEREVGEGWRRGGEESGGKGGGRESGEGKVEGERVVKSRKCKLTRTPSTKSMRMHLE